MARFKQTARKTNIKPYTTDHVTGWRVHTKKCGCNEVMDGTRVMSEYKCGTHGDEIERADSQVIPTYTVNRKRHRMEDHDEEKQARMEDHDERVKRDIKHRMSSIRQSILEVYDRRSEYENVDAIDLFAQLARVQGELDKLYGMLPYSVVV